MKTQLQQPCRANHIILKIFIFLAVAGLYLCPKTDAAEAPKSSLKLDKAAMCEGIADFAPVNPGIAFSVTVGKLICYTQFSGIEGDTSVLHKWYRRDELVTTKILMLKSPRWSTYSSIQLRESDRGPWRVDIVDADNRVLDVLRFSVTE